MIVANLTMLLVLGLGEPPVDAASLVGQLGSGRYAEREAAAVALEKLGREALPALRAALESRDIEVRTRAATLLEKIDSGLLTQPTMILLDFVDRPLEEVARSIGEQYGISVVVQPENDANLKMRKVTLKEAEPLPFWKAIDRLCEAAALQYNAGSMGVMMGRGPVFNLFAGISPTVPTSDSGPFRVSLISVHHHRDLMLGQQAMGAGGMMMPGMPGMMRMPQQVPPPPIRPGEVRVQPAIKGDAAALARSANDQFFIQMMIMAEPRLIFSASQELKLVEASDDRGQSLMRADAAQAQRTSAYYGYSMSAFVQMPIHLVYPDQPGKTIRTLRGVLPVSVSARRADPLVLPLKNEMVGKSVKGSEFSVTLNEIKLDANTNPPRTTLDITLRPLVASGDPAAPPGIDMLRGGFRAPNMFQNQLEILDAEGKVLQAIPSSPPNAQAQAQPDEVRFGVMLTPFPGTGAPAQLRYYSLSHAAVDVAFEFHDIPMP